MGLPLQVNKTMERQWKKLRDQLSTFQQQWFKMIVFRGGMSVEFLSFMNFFFPSSFA